MATLRLFAGLREAAGTSSDEVAGATVGEVLTAAAERYGAQFAAGLDTAKVWVNGEQADESTTVMDDDEVALIPPVSGGALASSTADVSRNSLSIALLAAVFIAAFVPLEWFVLIAVGAVLAWLWDLSEQQAASAAGFGVLPALFAPVAAATGAYAWGFEGLAAGVAVGVVVSLSWPIFDAAARAIESIMITTAVALLAGLGAGGLVLLRMISTTAVATFVLIALAGILGAWVAQSFGSQIQSLDPNVGALLGALLVGIILGLALSELETAAALLGSVAAAAGLIAGRALGSLVRRGEVVHTQAAPGLLTAVDGVIVAAPLFWLTLWVFG